MKGSRRVVVPMYCTAADESQVLKDGTVHDDGDDIVRWQVFTEAGRGLHQFVKRRKARAYHAA